MFLTLITKELKAIIQSPKFTATFAVCSVLMLLSVFVGINEYKQAVKQYDTLIQLNEQEMSEANSWENLSSKVTRKPTPMQILTGGLSYDIGRWSLVHRSEPIKLRHSTFTDDPIFALFRIIDFAFIVLYVLTLFAILFTYDAINGEREQGTLKLIFSNSVPRAKYLVAKIIGVWSGLVVPLLIPILLCLLMLNVFGIPISGTQWARTAAITGISILLFSFFIVLGILISALTRRSSISFLLSLLAWIVLVIIIPRMGALAAARIVDVPGAAEIDGQRAAYAKDKWANYHDGLNQRWLDRNGDNEGDSCPSDDKLAEWMAAEDSIRLEIENDIGRYDASLKKDVRRKQNSRLRLAYALSRISPAASYQIAVINLAGTDVEMKSRYEDAIGNYKAEFSDYTFNRGSTEPHGGIKITADSEKGLSVSVADEGPGLDLSDLPRFNASLARFSESSKYVIWDFGIIVLYIICAFAGAFVAFLRFDLR